MQAGSSGSDFYKKNKRNNNNKKPNKGTFYALIAVIVFLIISTVSGGIGNNGSMIKLSEFVNSVNNNQIEKVNVLNETVIGTLKDGTKFKVFFPESYIGKILDTLTQNNVAYDFTPIDGQRTLLDRLFGILFGLLSSLSMMLLSLWFLWPLISIRLRKMKSV